MMTGQNQQRQRIIQGIAKGEVAVQKRRVFTQEEAREKLAKWFGGKTKVV